MGNSLLWENSYLNIQIQNLRIPAGWRILKLIWTSYFQWSLRNLEILIGISQNPKESGLTLRLILDKIPGVLTDVLDG